MSSYFAPVKEMKFLMYDVFNANKFWQRSSMLSEAVDVDTANAILDESAKITETLIAPYMREVDENGVKFADGEVTTPARYKDIYNTISEGGWVGLTGNPEFGGMGMPKVLASMHDEMMCSADLSFSLYIGLTSAASLTLNQHASEELKSRYLEKLYSGVWSGTMCLTESHAGTDLGIMRTQAVDKGDGTYSITGTKIFITAGQHDLSENIVHLVLAKLPDAPAGSRGISLFVVPKFMVTENGELGEANQVSCGSIEHKMGLHGSPTCVMNFDGATGYLVGELNQGLANMFTMMNYERLSMGSQGVGCSERSYQNALAYAKERLQGIGVHGDRKGGPESIMVHPDVRRMLLNMKSLTEAGRAFNTFVALQLDKAKFADDEQERKDSGRLAELLTPIAKAFVTDMGLDTCVTGQQVFGGHGYIREWGMEQLVRDVRISQIYEGTNGIQALDLMGRKVVANGGATMTTLLTLIEDSATDAKGSEAEFIAGPLLDAIAELKVLTAEIVEKAMKDGNEVGAASVDYLHAAGYVLYGYIWLEMVKAALVADSSDSFYKTKLKTAKFYIERVLPRFYSKVATARVGADSLFAMDESEF